MNEQAPDQFDPAAPPSAQEMTWLDQIASDEPFDESDARAFVSRVIERWEKEQREPVVGRIRPLRVALIAGAWAAMLAVIVAIGLDRERAPIEPKPRAPQIGLLLDTVQRQYGEQSVRFGEVIDQSASLVDLERVIDLIPTGLPQPADESPDTSPQDDEHDGEDLCI